MISVECDVKELPRYWILRMIGIVTKFVSNSIFEYLLDFLQFSIGWFVISFTFVFYGIDIAIALVLPKLPRWGARDVSWSEASSIPG